MSASVDRLVRLGEISGVYGVRGWVKVLSFTEPRTNLFDYTRWLLEHRGGRRAVDVEATRSTGRNLLAKLADIDDRDEAAALIGAQISVPRRELPDCAPGEYYWADLEGLAVVNRAGEPLGTVERLVATGSNDVLVLDGGQMIPFVQGEIVISVDLGDRKIEVDWDPSYLE